MKKNWLILCLISACLQLLGQTNPAITSFIQHTTGLKGKHYVHGNSTPLQDNVLANVQSVQ